MAVPVLKEIGCGISVRTGSLIIGWLWMVVSIVICGVIVLNDKFYHVVDYYYSTNDNYFDLTNNNQTEHQIHKSTWELNEQNCFALGLIIVSAIFSGLYLMGIYKRRPNFMKFGMIPLGIVVYTSCLATFKNAFDEGITGSVFRQIIFFGITYYLLLVMYSHYRQLKFQTSNNYKILMSQTVVDEKLITSKDYPVKSSIYSIA